MLRLPPRSTRTDTLFPYTTLFRSDPEIMGGEPCFAGTRIPVRAVKAFAVAGSTPAEIVEEYPDLTEEDVRAGLAYFAPPTEPAAALIAAAEALEIGRAHV